MANQFDDRVHRESWRRLTSAQKRRARQIWRRQSPHKAVKYVARMAANNA